MQYLIRNHVNVHVKMVNKFIFNAQNYNIMIGVHVYVLIEKFSYALMI